MKHVFFVIMVLTLGCEKEKASDWVDDKPKGDFQILQIGEMRRDQFLIDKNTGNVWQKMCMDSKAKGPDCDYTAWMKMDVEGISATREVIYQMSELVSKQ